MCRSARVLAALALAAAGCGVGSSASTYDAAGQHSPGDGSRDTTGPGDALGPAVDADPVVAAGDAEAGPSVDAPSPSDAGLAPAQPCTGTPADVYADIPNLPPMSEALRGTVVACTTDPALDVAATQAQLDAKKDTGITAVTGCAVYRIQYRTTRGDGSAAVSSARVYLPQVPVVPEPPVVVAAHGTEGLAASCATSMNATSMEDLALPWVALGYPVIAPDYAGLGTTGVQGYEDNRDTARSVVDAVAALRQFVDRPLGQQVVIDGHSQGGGAALATQSLAASMGLRGTLAAVIAFAPEYFSRMGSLGYVASLESAASTNPLTISTGVTKCTVATMMEYAYFANHVVGAAPTDGFPASDATKLGGAITSLCTVPLGGAVQLDAPHVADWTDGTFRGEFLACVNGVGDGGTACTGAGAAFFGFLSQNLLPPDPAGAPVLVVQGLADTVMPPAEEAACNVDALQAGGLTPTVCTDSAATHTDVVARNIAFGITWAQAIVAGTAAPACTASALPACSQP